jgi:hypothetical protein
MPRGSQAPTPASSETVVTPAPQFDGSGERLDASELVVSSESDDLDGGLDGGLDGVDWTVDGSPCIHLVLKVPLDMQTTVDSFWREYTEWMQKTHVMRREGGSDVEKKSREEGSDVEKPRLNEFYVAKGVEGNVDNASRTDNEWIDGHRRSQQQRQQGAGAGAGAGGMSGEGDHGYVVYVMVEIFAAHTEMSRHAQLINEHEGIAAQLFEHQRNFGVSSAIMGTNIVVRSSEDRHADKPYVLWSPSSFSVGDPCLSMLISCPPERVLMMDQFLKDHGVWMHEAHNLAGAAAAAAAAAAGGILGSIRDLDHSSTSAAAVVNPLSVSTDTNTSQALAKSKMHKVRGGVATQAPASSPGVHHYFASKGPEFANPLAPEEGQTENLLYFISECYIDEAGAKQHVEMGMENPTIIQALETFGDDIKYPFHPRQTLSIFAKMQQLPRQLSASEGDAPGRGSKPRAMSRFSMRMSKNHVSLI